MSAYDEVYKQMVVYSPSFWKLNSIDKIGDFLSALTLNSIIYTTDECLAANMSYNNHPIIGVEIQTVLGEDKPRKTAYYIATEDATHDIEGIINAKKQSSTR